MKTKYLLSRYTLLVSFLLSALLFISCSQSREKNIKIKDVYQLNDPSYLIGCDVQASSLTRCKERIPSATYEFYPWIINAYTALINKKVDAVTYDRAPMEYAAASNPDFFVLPENLGDGKIAMILPQGKEILLRQVNEFINQYRADGTYKDMYDRWIHGLSPKMPDIPVAKNPVGKLVIGTNGEDEPMCFFGENKKLMGFDIELVERLCLYLNVSYEYKIIVYDALIPAVQSGMVDIAIANADATDERKNVVLFSDSYIDSPAAIMVRTEDVSEEVLAACGVVRNPPPSWIDSFISSCHRCLLTENRWKMILEGLEVTLLITILATILGSLLGTGICMVRRSTIPLFANIAAAFIRIIQGVPVLVFLMVLYYVIFRNVYIHSVGVAVVAFAINFSVYFAEMLRSGIGAVEHGQIEAATALGFNRYNTFILIVLPQAIKHIMPVYKGEVISMLKMTSIVGYIAIQDLTRMGDIIRSRTYDAFFPLIMTALIYLGISYLLAFFLSQIEFKVDTFKRPRKLKGVIES